MIRGARQLLTLNGPTGPRRGSALESIGLIQDGAVLIVNGVVSAVGPARRVENLAEARDAEEINASGRVVMPSFVDPHAYLLAGSPFIEREEIQELLMPGPEFDAPRKPRLVAGQIRTTPATTIEHRGRKLLELCIRHGTGTVEAKCGYGLDESIETKLLRVLGKYNSDLPTVIPSFMIPEHAHSGDYPEREQYLSWIIGEFLPKLGKRKLAHFVGVECESLRCCDKGTVAKLLDAIVAARLVPKIHTNGAEPESIEIAIRRHVASFDGLQSVGTIGVNAIAACPALAVLTPADGAPESSPHPPARTLIDCGVAVALGTGLHHSPCSTYNMQFVVSMACSRLKMTTAEAICAATLNAAHAVRRADRVGSLQFGKNADILILAISDYREMSYYFGVNQVQLAMKNGETVFHDPGYRI